MKKKAKICKHCKTELPKGTKICPNCHKKQKMGLLPKAAIVIILLGIIGSCGNDDSSTNEHSSKESQETEATKETVSITEAESTTSPEISVEETSASVESPEETTVSETVNETTVSTQSAEEWASVKALGLDNSTMISIYNDYEKAWESSPEDPSKQSAYEEQVAAEIGKTYGISADDADQVYMYALLHYSELTSNSADLSNMKLTHGELLNVTVNGSTIVLKAKISSSFTKKLTIQSCYFAVYDAVQKYNLNTYDELQYWAVADMTNGSEQKVISFTIPKDTLDKIVQKKIVGGQLADYATDVWISSALK